MMTKRITTMVAALTVAGLLGACGGDGDSGGSDDDVASLSDDDSGEQAQSDQDDTDEELLDWVECMRDEGVDIPDPTRDENGNLVLEGPAFRIGGGPSDSTDDADGSDDGDEPAFTPEEMEAAEETCGPPELGPSDISEEDLQAQEEAILEFADCMRDEGIEDFPDPDFSDMGPGGDPQPRTTEDSEPGDGSGNQDDEVVSGPFGEIDMNDPEVAAAFEACQDLLGAPGEDGGPIGGPPAG
jgi:hypothetical protein